MVVGCIVLVELGGQRPLVSDRWLVSVCRVKLSLCLVNGETLQCLLRHCGLDPQSVFGDGVRVCCVGELVNDRWSATVG